MRKLFLTSAIVLICITVTSQTKSDLEIIKSVADNVIKNTSYTIIDPSNGQQFESSKGLKANKQYKIASPYLEWHYWNGVLNVAMLELYKATGDEKYKSHSYNYYKFIFENLNFFDSLYKAGVKQTGMDPFFRMQMLDDCGSLGAGLIEVYKTDKNNKYREYIDKVAEYITQKEHRLKDGTLARTGPYDKTLWLDDLYMSIPFIARYAKLTNDNRYFEFAANQVMQFTEYLFDKNEGIYYHCYFDSLHEPGVAHWGRANGWCIVAQVNLLDALPENYPARDSLIKIFRQQVTGLARYQSETGLWHQLLDKPDSYLETSCTAMFTYAIAKGVNNGWLDERFKTIALAGWEGLKTKIQEDGQVQDICIGTGIENDLVFYYKRPRKLNDIHGLGAVILAGTEITKLTSHK